MTGVLYIVATPIGNLDDISARAVSVLREVDLIAAEDTRHSRQLLDHLGIDTPMLALHDHNEETRSPDLVERMRDGQQIALISDAGTPLISDPGYQLVRLARDAGVRVSPIPGASSLMAALSAAGLPTDSFYFAGFLPAKGEERRTRLRRIAGIRTTVVLFESTHRIETLLQDLAEELGDREVVVAKELTKMHERFLAGDAASILAQLQAEPALTRGEFVVLINNAARSEDARLNSDDCDVIKLLLQEVSVKTAVKIAAKITGKKKNEIYRLALELGEDEAGDERVKT